MKNLFIITGLAMSFALGACQNGSGQERRPQELNAATYEQKLGSTGQAQLIDVRTWEEYQEGHINGAVNIDINGSQFSAEAAKLDKNRPVFVYCQSGRRSARAASDLLKMGFPQVYNLDGGIQSWREAGKPVER